MRVFHLQGGEKRPTEMVRDMRGMRGKWPTEMVRDMRGMRGKWPTEMVRDMRGMRGKWPTEIVRDMRGMRGKSESRQELVRDNLPTEPFCRAGFHVSSAHVAGK